MAQQTSSNFIFKRSGVAWEERKTTGKYMAAAKQTDNQTPLLVLSALLKSQKVCTPTIFATLCTQCWQ